MLLIIISFTAGVVSQRAGFSNFIAKPIIMDGLGIAKRQVLSMLTKPDQITLDIPYKNYMELLYARDEALIKGTVYGTPNNWVNLKIRFKGEVYKAKIRLKGATSDEHLADDKWSFKIKLKDSKTILGMNEFAVMSPRRRNLLGQWFIRKVFQKEGLIARKYEFVKIIINGEDKGIYVIDERYDNNMLTRNQRKEGPVIKIEQSPIFIDQINSNIDRDNYYLALDYTAFDLDSLLEDEVTKRHFLNAKYIIEEFRLGNLKTSVVFDIDLLAKWFAISDVMGAWHGFGWANMRFYYNPITSLFEPVPDDDFNEMSLNYTSSLRLFRLHDQYNDSIFLRNIFSDYQFVEKYIEELGRVSQDSYLVSVFNEFNNEISDLSNILAKDYPFYNFLFDSKNNIFENALKLRKLLNPAKPIQSYFEEYTLNKQLVLSVANNQSIPIKVLYLEDKQGNKFMPNTDNLILSGKKYLNPIDFQTYGFNTNNTTLLSTLEKPSELKLFFNLIGSSKKNSIPVIPFRAHAKVIDYKNITKQNENIKNFPFINWDKKNRTITFYKGSWILSEDLIIPPYQTLYINDGVNLDMINSSMILSYSPVIILGSKENLVTISSSDKTGSGITVLNAINNSVIRFAKFDGLSNPKRDSWQLTGSINFYQSPVHIFESSFSSNLGGDDYVNIIRSDYSIENSSFEDSFSDSLDIDFSKGIIKNSIFSNCGVSENNGDCLDFSGSQVHLENITINRASDKGISIGEGTTANIYNSKISFSKIAIASKDQSKSIINNLDIAQSKVGIAIFKKKPAFESSSLEVEGLSMKNVDEPYLVEKGSSLYINSERIPDVEKNLKDRFYE
ncbi:MAG: CotH kinase family protein [Gammaproteobacteria bacterium]|nr:CotH kinase family protein [Gammaproteobacteria bacterium]